MGVHIDGMQGDRYEYKKLRACHTYMAVDCVPPFFYCQRFDLKGMNPMVNNFHDLLSDQLKEGALLKDAVGVNDIFLYSAYQAHNQLVIDSPGKRFVYRLDVSEKFFDRVSNSTNPSDKISCKLSVSDRDISYTMRHKAPVSTANSLKIKAPFRNCEACHEPVFLNYHTLCELCRKKKEWKETVAKATKFYKQELRNSEIQLWCATNPPKLEFDDFKLYVLRTDVLYAKATRVEFVFYSVKRQQEVIIRVPISKIENLMQLDFKGPLIFKTRKRIKALAQGQG